MFWYLRYALITALIICGCSAAPMHDEEEESNGSSSNGRVLYDQRQTGKYNIHVSIKDVAIIEVDQNEIADETYNEEDYYYDDADLTIKPIKFTTASTTTTASESTATTTTKTTAQPTIIGHLNRTTTTTTAATPTMLPTSTQPLYASNFSANLLADIAATRAAQRYRNSSKPSNLIIMETPIGGTATRTDLRARNKDALQVQPSTAPTTPHIEYTPPQGHNSPIFKVKVQRAVGNSESTTTLPSSTLCRLHQFRDVHGKCRTKRSGSIL